MGIGTIYGFTGLSTRRKVENRIKLVQGGSRYEIGGEERGTWVSTVEVKRVNWGEEKEVQEQGEGGRIHRALSKTGFRKGFRGMGKK